jgi:hypothetical protein
MRTLIGIVVVASGCNATMTDDAPASLRVDPSSIELAVDLAQLAPAVSLHVFAVDSSGSETDVTGEASFAFDGLALGTVTGGTLTSDGLTGGTTMLRATYDQAAAAVPATANVTERRIAAGTAAGAADAFATATAAPFAAHLDPEDGAVLPAGIGRMVLSFAAPDLDDTEQILVTAPYLNLEIVTPGVAGPRELELSPSEWGAITHTARGGAIQLDVASLSSSAPATSRTAAAGLEIADLAPSALLAGGTVGDATDASPIRPMLWRYDMQMGTAAPMFTNPAGACIGCHLAVSADGTRIAALIVTPAQPELYGVVLDPAGTVMTQAFPTSTSPWATAAFDPGGQLLAAWQGGLALREADTGVIVAPVAMTETASAPTISPDGTALAYVTLDSGFGDGASQPIGNALHVRPWNAATASVGAPIELAREAAGVVLPNFSSDGAWVAYGHGTPDPTRLNEVPLGSSAVRADGSGTSVALTADPLDQLAHFASPIAPGRAGGRGAEPMVWIAVNSTRPVGGNATSPQQLWLEVFYPERGVITPAFHLPGQPAALKVLHGPIALPARTN